MKKLPSDLSLLNRTLPQPAATSAQLGWVSAFLQVCEELEPDMVPEEKDRAAWLEGVGSLRKVVREVKFDDVYVHSLGVKAEVYTQLEEIALRSWRGPSASVRQLPFISDAALRAIAERDLVSLGNIRKCEETKACLILAGGVVEATLLDVIRRNLHGSKQAAQSVKAARAATDPRWKGFEASQPHKWDFRQLIAVCGPQGLRVLSDRTERVADAVRDYRNLVHPDDEIKETQSGPILTSEADVAAGLMEQVLEQVRTWTASTVRQTH